MQVDELLQRVEVVGEAAEDGLELVARLVAEAVLAEHAALGEVLADELLVVGRQRSAQLDRRRRGRRGRGRRHGQWCRHGGGRGRLQVDLEASLALLLAQPSQLRPVLLVVRLELHEHLEDRRGLVEAAVAEVRLDHQRVRLCDQHVVARLAVELDELREAANVRRIPLNDLLQQRRAAIDLPPLDELVHGGEQLVVRLVEPALGEVHLAELLARLEVGGILLQQRLEHPARLVAAARTETRLREPQRDVAVGRCRAARLIEEAHRLREVLLDDVHPRGRGEEARAARHAAQGLVEQLQGLGEQALLDELVGDRAVLAGRLVGGALARVELGEPDPHLHVRWVDVGHAAQDLAGLAQLVALHVLVVDEAERLLRLGGQPLARVEVPEAHVPVEKGRVVAQHLLPQGDRLEVEAVVGEEAGDLDVLLVGRLRVVELRVEVADAVDRVPVPRVVLDDQLQRVDRLVEAAGLLRCVGVLLQLDLVDLGH